MFSVLSCSLDVQGQTECRAPYNIENRFVLVERICIYVRIFAIVVVSIPSKCRVDRRFTCRRPHLYTMWSSRGRSFDRRQLRMANLLWRQRWCRPVPSGKCEGVGEGEFTLEIDPSRFIRHVSTLAKESSSGMIRINTTLTSHEQYGDLPRGK